MRNQPADSLLAASLRTLLDAAANPSLAVNGEGQIVYANERVVTTFGHDAVDLLGRPIEVLVPSALAARHRSHVDSYLADPTPRPMGSDLTLRARRRDGSEFPVEVSLAPVPATAAARVVVTLTDITARLARDEQNQTLTRGYRTLARLNQVVAEAPDERTLYVETCRILVEEGGYLGAAVGVPSPDLTATVMARAGHLPLFGRSLTVSLDPASAWQESPMASALVAGRTTYLADILSEETLAAWHPVARAEGFRSLMTMPVVCRDEVVGALTVLSAAAQLPEAALRRLMEEVGVNLTVGLDSLRDARRVHGFAVQRGLLTERLVGMQESERVRIAGDLHDESVQSLAALDLRLGLLRNQVVGAAPDLVRQVDQIQESVGAAAAGLRDVLLSLDPGSAEAGLATTLREVAHHLFEGGEARWSVSGDAPADLPAVVLVQAQRIAKEALFGVRRLTGLTSVDVHLDGAAGGLSLEVRVSLVGATWSDQESDGIWERMRGRAEVAGGGLRVRAVPDGDLTVSVWLPREVTLLDSPLPASFPVASVVGEYS